MFGLFVYITNQGANIDLARTMVVNMLVLLEAVYLINCRQIYGSILSKVGLFGSKSVLTAISLAILLQLGFTYLPFMQYLFKTQPIDLLQWGIIVIIAIFIFFLVELEKMIVRYFQNLRKQEAFK
jgi:magnesium-transporting ATPase (P-type)